LVRALHAVTRPEAPLIAARGRRPPLGDLPDGATLYVDAEALAPEGALVVQAVIEDARVWVLIGVEPGAPSLVHPLAARLRALVVTIPPLRERGAEIDDLAVATLQRLADRLGRGPMRLTPEARSRLIAHAWPGDVAELEAILARALLLVEGDEVDAHHLALEAPPTPPVVTGPPAGPERAALEFLLAELAHELRNPMVTIKTYAQHLPALLEDADLRARFAALCDDAVGRMDALLENVLTFARLGAPRPEPIEVGSLLDRVLRDVQVDLSARAVRVRRGGSAAARCAADPEQLTYALRNLLTAVVREVPAREELTLDTAANGVVTLRFATGGAATERLRRIAAPDNGARDLGDPSLLPLAFRLARAVLERNGGSLALVSGGTDVTTMVVRLPPAQAVGR
jgi:signal transduction histidine kinase